MTTLNTSSTKYNIERYIQGINGFGLKFAFDNFSTKLVANNAQSLTIPSNYQNWIAIFTYESGENVWVANNTTATVPGNSFASTKSQLNPPARLVQAGDVLSFISDTAGGAYVDVSLYVAQDYTN